MVRTYPRIIHFAIIVIVHGMEWCTEHGVLDEGWGLGHLAKREGDGDAMIHLTMPLIVRLHWHSAMHTGSLVLFIFQTLPTRTPGCWVELPPSETFCVELTLVIPVVQ
jgi:hypothetical protein